MAAKERLSSILQQEDFTQSLAYRTLSLGKRNTERNIQDIPDRFLVLPHLGFLSHIVHRDQVEKTWAAELVAQQIAQQLKQRELVVIEDGSRHMVYGIEMKPAPSRTANVTIIDRYAREKMREMEVANPKFVGIFFEGERGTEFMLKLHKNGQKEIGQALLTISSAGNTSPRHFTIGTSSNVLFARIDVRHSLTCAWEHEGPTAWFVSGENWEQILKDHLRRERERIKQALRRTTSR